MNTTEKLIEIIAEELIGLYSNITIPSTETPEGAILLSNKVNKARYQKAEQIADRLTEQPESVSEDLIKSLTKIHSQLIKGKLKNPRNALGALIYTLESHPQPQGISEKRIEEPSNFERLSKLEEAFNVNKIDKSELIRYGLGLGEFLRAVKELNK